MLSEIIQTEEVKYHILSYEESRGKETKKCCERKKETSEGDGDSQRRKRRWRKKREP